MKQFCILAFVASLAALSFGSAAQAEEDTFNNPKVGSQPLDLCLNWGADCGKPAADAWCVSQGYDESTNHVVAPDIAGWRRERLTPFPDTAFIDIPPDWLAEVLSPATQAIDRTGPP